MARIFKIGNVKIDEDPSMIGMSNDQVRELLKSQYPELTEATIRETTEGDTTFVEWLPKPGRKG